MTETAPDPDDLDGCSVGAVEHPDDDETSDLRALFPEGVPDPAKAAEWKELFSGS